jgi:hypothetical protein
MVTFRWALAKALISTPVFNSVKGHKTLHAIAMLVERDLLLLALH